jgi:two-component system sensor histidine kinase ChvG
MGAAQRLAAALPRWLWPIRTRFLAVHLLLVTVPVAGIGFARFYEREMLAALEQDMVH